MKKLYAEITKAEEQEDGSIIVYGIASSPNRDSDGEIVTAEAMAKALPDYLKFGAVREMHDGSKAAGTAIDAKVESDGNTSFSAMIVDPLAVKKVQSKVYKGFSIGGRVLERDPGDDSVITGLKLIEVSLVDRPANPEAVLTMFKSDDADKAPHDPSQLDAITKLQSLVNDGGLTPAELVALAEAHLAKNDEVPEEPETDAPVEPEADAPTPEPEEVKESAETVAQGLDALSKALDGRDLKKGLNGIQALAAVIYQLVAVQAGIKREADDEGDNSPVPAKVADLISGLLDALVEMTAEEVGELKADMAEAGMEPEAWFYYAEQVGNLAKSERFEAVPHSDGLAKAEVSKALADIGRLRTENATLAKRVKELEDMPAPPKAALKVVEKGQDIGVSDAQKAEEMPNNLSPDQRAALLIKKAHLSGPTIARFS